MDEIKKRIMTAIETTQSACKLAPDNPYCPYWSGRIDGLNSALNIIALSESGKMIDLSDAMTPEEIEAVNG
jgi:hypothetical protein